MFNREFISASSAVGFGALIGGLLSIEIATHFHLGNFLWIFGAIFGGCVSYVIVEFKKFCAGVSDAYRKTISWRPYVPYWKALLLFYTGICFATSTISLGMFSLFSALDDSPKMVFVDVLYISVILAVVLAFLFALATLSRQKWMVGRKYTRHLLIIQSLGYVLITRCNPFTMPFVVLSYLGRWVISTVRTIPEIASGVVVAGKTVRGLVVLALKNVHSQKRAVVFFDATMGAVIGYLLGSALLGALIGATVLYPLHRELIAVRLLKVVPR